jgi:hypothetical protein
MGREPKEVHRSHRQSGRVRSIAKDKMLPAMYPGRRLSANGKFYWETRKSRSDLSKETHL